MSVDRSYFLKAERLGFDRWGADDRGLVMVLWGDAQGIFAGHHPKNEASKNMIEKVGFRHTHDELYSPTEIAHSCYLLMKPIEGERVRSEG